MGSSDEELEKLKSKIIDEQFEQLELEIEKELGHKIYFDFLNSQQWGLYSTENHKGNFGYVRRMVQSDECFPHWPFPHLRVAVNKDWADSAGVKPGAIIPDGWYKKGHDAACWCIPEGDNEKLKKVAKFLKRIYLNSPAKLR